MDCKTKGLFSASYRKGPGAGCVLFFALNFNASALGPGEN